MVPLALNYSPHAHKMPDDAGGQTQKEEDKNYMNKKESDFDRNKQSKNDRQHDRTKHQG